MTLVRKVKNLDFNFYTTRYLFSRVGLRTDPFFEFIQLNQWRKTLCKLRL